MEHTSLKFHLSFFRGELKLFLINI